MARGSSVTFEIDSTPLRNYLRDLAEISGKTTAEVTLLTAQTVCGKASALTKKSSKVKIKSDFERQEWITMSGKKYRLANRYSAKVFAKIDYFRLQRLNFRLENIGLGRRSFFELAKKVPGVLRIKVPAKVASAGHPSVAALQPDNVSVHTTGSESSSRYTVHLRNSSPVATSFGAQGARAMRRAIYARRSAFNRDLEKGVFRDAKLRAARYPGIFVKEGV